MKTVNVIDFSGAYVLKNLTPSTLYGIYIRAVRLIKETNEVLQGNSSITATAKTLGKQCIQMITYRQAM